LLIEEKEKMNPSRRVPPNQATKEWHSGNVTLSPSTSLRINSAQGFSARFFALLRMTLGSGRIGKCINGRCFNLKTLAILTLLILPPLLLAQTHPQPSFGPPLKPLVKLTGYLNATVPKENVRPVLTVKLPDDEKRHTFWLTDLQVMAGPLRTPESILAEVKPYSPNFRFYGSQAAITQIASATPIERLVILAEYSSADRVLLVQNVEKDDSNLQ
jgi:hypothetical protein